MYFIIFSYDLSGMDGAVHEVRCFLGKDKPLVIVPSKPTIKFYVEDSVCYFNYLIVFLLCYYSLLNIIFFWSHSPFHFLGPLYSPICHWCCFERNPFH